jgi:hypothetical protein
MEWRQLEERPRGHGPRVLVRRMVPAPFIAKRVEHYGGIHTRPSTTRSTSGTYAGSALVLGSPGMACAAA